jgi:hypothetical protein
MFVNAALVAWLWTSAPPSWDQGLLQVLETDYGRLVSLG